MSKDQNGNCKQKKEVWEQYSRVATLVLPDCIWFRPQPKILTKTLGAPSVEHHKYNLEQVTEAVVTMIIATERFAMPLHSFTSDCRGQSIYCFRKKKVRKNYLLSVKKARYPFTGWMDSLSSLLTVTLLGWNQAVNKVMI